MAAYDAHEISDKNPLSIWKKMDGMIKKLFTTVLLAVTDSTMAPTVIQRTMAGSYTSVRFLSWPDLTDNT